MVRKTEEELAKAVRHLETLVDTTRAQVHQRCDSQLQDKVGVEEVQSAFKRLTDSFNRKNMDIEQ